MSNKASLYELPRVSGEASEDRYAVLPEKSVELVLPMPQNASSQPDDTYQEVEASLDFQGSTKVGLDDDTYTNVSRDFTTPLWNQQEAAGSLQDQTFLMQNEASVKNLVRPCTFKRITILALILFLAVLFLMSAGALALGLFNFMEGSKVQDAELQAVTNKTKLANSKYLANRIKILEASLSQLQRRLDQQTAVISMHFMNTSATFDDLDSRMNARDEFTSARFTSALEAVADVSLKLNVSINSINNQLNDLNERDNFHSAQFTSTLALLTSLASEVNTTSSDLITLSSVVTAKIDSINTQLLTTTADISGLSSSVNASINSFRTQLAATLADFLSLNATISSISNQVISTSTAVTSLSSRLTSPVDLYHSCYQDTASCIVSQHRETPYWFLCLTPFVIANVTVSTLSWV